MAGELAVFVNNILLEEPAYSFMYCLWLPFCYHGTVEQLRTETVWPTKPKIFTSLALYIESLPTSDLQDEMNKEETCTLLPLKFYLNNKTMKELRCLKGVVSRFHDQFSLLHGSAQVQYILK